MLNRNVLGNSREIRSGAGPATTDGTSVPDDFLSRLVKLIPSEVIAVYIGIDGILRGAQPPIPLALAFWVVFALMLAGTPLYLWRVQHVHRASQLAISTVSFALWVFATGGAAQEVVHLNPSLGAIALILYTFFVPILLGGNDPSVAPAAQ